MLSRLFKPDPRLIATVVGTGSQVAADWGLSKFFKKPQETTTNVTQSQKRQERPQIK